MKYNWLTHIAKRSSEQSNKTRALSPPWKSSLIIYGNKHRMWAWHWAGSGESDNDGKGLARDAKTLLCYVAMSALEMPTVMRYHGQGSNEQGSNLCRIEPNLTYKSSILGVRPLFVWPLVVQSWDVQSLVVRSLFVRSLSVEPSKCLRHNENVDFNRPHSDSPPPQGLGATSIISLGYR
jgi:hypothetical protein